MLAAERASAEAQRTPLTPGLRFYQWMMQKDPRARVWNQQRLRELKRDHGAEVQVFSGRDLSSSSGCHDQPASRPAELPPTRGLEDEERI